MAIDSDFGGASIGEAAAAAAAAGAAQGAAVMGGLLLLHRGGGTSPGPWWGACGGGGAALRGVSSLFLHAYVDRGAERALRTAIRGDGSEDGLPRPSPQDRSLLVGCQLWCESSSTAVVLHQIASLLPSGVTMLPPTALLPPQNPSFRAGSSSGPNALHASEALLDALNEEVTQHLSRAASTGAFPYNP